MSITIQFVSAYVCPFCYINKVALEKARAEPDEVSEEGGGCGIDSCIF